MKLLTAILSLIAGMNVVFGGEPEPVLDGKIC